MKKAFLYSFLIISGINSCISCASKKGFSGNGDLCGMIVDENNEPVQGFVITCSSTDETVVTNNNGIFVITNLRTGKYYISGEKIGYARISNEPFNFISRDIIFCCKVNSLDGAIESVEKQLKCQNYEAALKLLDGLCIEPKTQDEVTVCYFEALTNLLAGNKDAAQKNIEILLQNPLSKNTELTKKLEGKINEILY